MPQCLLSLLVALGLAQAPQPCCLIRGDIIMGEEKKPFVIEVPEIHPTPEGTKVMINGQLIPVTDVCYSRSSIKIDTEQGKFRFSLLDKSNAIFKTAKLEYSKEHLEDRLSK